jgi:phosphoribosylformimino-5-aminoimidazole carboxamide ribotide isomerase
VNKKALMRLIPVMDLKGGKVVHAIAGQRDRYKPIVSRLTSSHAPIDVGRALLETFEPAELYVADLDAICDRRPDWATLHKLRELGVDLWVDAGIQSTNDVRRLAEAGIAGLVCGLETIRGPEVLAAVVSAVGADRTIFSLDMREGQMLGDLSLWPLLNSRDYSSVVDCAMDAGVRRVIMLDLACVGGGRGTTTEQMCHRMVSRYPNLEFYVGGGVGSREDLIKLQACGAAGVLAASALHDVGGRSLRKVKYAPHQRKG